MITAVLLKYKRPKELSEIVEFLKAKPFINEVLVWDNSTGENIINYGRYCLAARAKNDTIYTQDDDCIIGNIDHIYGLYDGTKLVNGLKKSRLKKSHIMEDRSTICGWGTFFDKGWISVLNRYLDKYGEDYLFHREADRIFTGLLDVPRLSVEADVQDFPSAVADFALSLQPEHDQTAELARKRVNDIITGSP